jgi:hypothetical protein
VNKAKKRKRTVRHLHFNELGGETAVRFNPKWVTVRVRIPRGRLAQRLSAEVRKTEHLKKQVSDLKGRVSVLEQEKKDLLRFGKIPQRFPRKYLSEIGSKGGKAGSANMTKEQRVARAKKARAAQLENQKGGSNE